MCQDDWHLGYDAFALKVHIIPKQCNCESFVFNLTVLIVVYIANSAIIFIVKCPISLFSKLLQIEHKINVLAIVAFQSKMMFMDQHARANF